MGSPKLPDLVVFGVFALIGFAVSLVAALGLIGFVAKLIWEGGKVVFQ